jgi:triacylglycerol lipase
MIHSRTHPIILAHGFARFDVLTNRLFEIDNKDGDDSLHYFKNIRTHLQAHGFTVYHTNVPWAGGVKERSRALKEQVETILAAPGVERVHIIAHSMGGLDTRHMLYDHRGVGFHEKVASLTTLGTPHHGSPVADAIKEDLIHFITERVFSIEGISDLKTEACARFNEQADAWESSCGVRFRAYAGAQPRRQIFWPLKISWRIIHDQEGDNDGLVSVQSARWKDAYFVPPVLEADHLNLLGWWDVDEFFGGESREELETRIKKVYLDIAEELAREFPR